MNVCSITYHEVTDNPADSGFQRETALPYKHGVKEFEDHVTIFKKHNIFTPKIQEIDFSNKIENTFLITFDDGGTSAMTAANILEKNNLIGHFLITTSFIGKKYYLSESNVKELHDRGHVIGGHSHTHPDIFYNLSYDKMLAEWVKCKGILEDLIEESVTCASVPGGEMNDDTWRSSADAGFKFLLCSEPFFVPKTKYNILLGRVCPKKGADYKKVENFIQFKGYQKEMLIREAKNAAKLVVYPIQNFIAQIKNK